IIAISVWMYFTLEGIAQTKGLNIWTFHATGEMSLAVLFIANMGFWSTMAIDIPNLTRFLKVRPSRRFTERNRNVFLAQLVALPVQDLRPRPGLDLGVEVLVSHADDHRCPVCSCRAPHR
ncbi:MAG TPA: hypothetical protein PLL33_14875, partial [Paracoccus sp. (in: a-proteobacteria)]|nr:hypothetical protein [Paracoccus sp. (in: a-proteobacteria)]